MQNPIEKLEELARSDGISWDVSFDIQRMYNYHVKIGRIPFTGEEVEESAVQLEVAVDHAIEAYERKY